MTTVALPPPLHRLVASIETVERLDVLLHMKGLKGRSSTAQSVATSCGGSPQAAEHHLSRLCARGFLAVEIGMTLYYSFRPVDPALRKATDELEQALRTRREEVMALFERSAVTALVVEDDRDMREILRVFLDSRGFRTIALPHGRDAVLAAETENLAVAVVDVPSSLPQGMSLVRTLRERTRAVSTIVMTRFGDAPLLSRIAALGVTDVVEKPFELDDFERMVERYR